jgi:tellurite resistance protein
MILGAVVLLYVTGLVSYAAKLTRRPSVLREELRTMPGRLGLSAFVTCFYLLATTLSPYLPDLARGVFWAGLALHLALIALILQTFATGPAEQRRYSPAGHLYFVSPVVGAVTAALGRLFLACLRNHALCRRPCRCLWAWGADRLIREGMSPPLRPLLALHLAPAAVIGLAAALLGLLGVAM